MSDKKRPDLSTYPLDYQFTVLLHKKLMGKTGSAKRRAKKYYSDQYKKTGVIPKALVLAGKGIMEGRKCSGRRSSVSENIKNRFSEMVKSSADPDDSRFIFVTQKARQVKTYHKWLEEDFGQPISLSALYHYANKENLRLYLEKDDFEDDSISKYFFNPEPVFNLIQVDGCVCQYFKIKSEDNKWTKPQVIEFFDTGSRYMFIIDWYFSESSENSVDLFTRFLLSTPFPEKQIRWRPDSAKGFLNLKRPVHELNLSYSIRPDGFYMAPDFSRIYRPKDKAHLESSHRSLHSFESRIIRKYEKKIVRTKPGYLFKSNKMKKITVTYLDITINELRDSKILEVYQKEHNEEEHNFSEGGKTIRWIPKEKLHTFLSNQETFTFDPAEVKGFMKYGFDKIKASVSKKRIITHNKQKYYVAVGAEKFSRQRSTEVYISNLGSKLLIFEYKDDGIFIGEALPQGPYEKARFVKEKMAKAILGNEVEQIADFLKTRGMTVNTVDLITRHRKGLTLAMAKRLYESNKARYDNYAGKLQHAPGKIGVALFNAFLSDCERYQRKTHVAPYATGGEIK